MGFKIILSLWVSSYGVQFNNENTFRKGLILFILKLCKVLSRFVSAWHFFFVFHLLFHVFYLLCLDAIFGASDRSYGLARPDPQL